MKSYMDDNNGFGLWEWTFAVGGLILVIAFLIMTLKK